MRTIEPIDKTIIPPEVVSDRSDVVKKVYESPLKKVDIPELPPEKVPPPRPDTRRRIHYKDMLRINLLVVIPYILSFIAISAIFALPTGTDMTTAMSSRIAMIAWAVPAVIPWAFALFRLNSELWNTNVQFSAFLFIYSLFILPVLDISITLQARGVPSFVFLIPTFVLSQSYLLLIARSLVRKIAPTAPIFMVTSLVLLAVVL